MILESILSCPSCNHKESQILHENIVPVSFRCEACNKKSVISAGECCIYCVFGDSPCLQSQISGGSCCGSLEE